MESTSPFCFQRIGRDEGTDATGEFRAAGYRVDTIIMRTADKQWVGKLPEDAMIKSRRR